MRDVVVVGGGCYGTFYATQLAKAKERGKAEFRSVIVVDRDEGCRARRELPATPDRVLVTAEWGAFFDEFLGSARRSPPVEPGDYIVPSPHMPHLMFEWVRRRAVARWPRRAIAVDPVPGKLDLPYDRVGSDGTRFVSFAGWICPTHCIEPAVCPAIGSARTWEMASAISALAEQLRRSGQRVFGPALFICRHHVFGVGTFAVDAVLEGDKIVANAGADRGRGEGGAHAEPRSVLVGTISSCHGAVNLLRIGADDV
jgi:glycine/D-amino acid oxidase-like deaminating enzyme